MRGSISGRSCADAWLLALGIYGFVVIPFLSFAAIAYSWFLQPVLAPALAWLPGCAGMARALAARTGPYPAGALSARLRLVTVPAAAALAARVPRDTATTVFADPSELFAALDAVENSPAWMARALAVRARYLMLLLGLSPRALAAASLDADTLEALNDARIVSAEADNASRVAAEVAREAEVAEAAVTAAVTAAEAAEVAEAAEAAAAAARPLLPGFATRLGRADDSDEDEVDNYYDDDAASGASEITVGNHSGFAKSGNINDPRNRRGSLTGGGSRNPKLPRFSAGAGAEAGAEASSPRMNAFAATLNGKKSPNPQPAASPRVPTRGGPRGSPIPPLPPAAPSSVPAPAVTHPPGSSAAIMEMAMQGINISLATGRAAKSRGPLLLLPGAATKSATLRATGAATLNTNKIGSAALMANAMKGINTSVTSGRMAPSCGPLNLGTRSPVGGASATPDAVAGGLFADALKGIEKSVTSGKSAPLRGGEQVINRN